MRSKAVAAWAGLVLGVLGAHRFYLHGLRDRIGWLHPLPAVLGAVGVWRMRTLGVDDRLGNVLAPLFGAVLAAALLQTIVIGLTPKERWDARFGGGGDSGWPSVIAVVLALAVGSTAALSTIALVAQRAFEAFA